MRTNRAFSYPLKCLVDQVVGSSDRCYFLFQSCRRASHQWGSILDTHTTLSRPHTHSFTYTHIRAHKAWRKNHHGGFSNNTQAPSRGDSLHLISGMVIGHCLPLVLINIWKVLSCTHVKSKCLPTLLLWLNIPNCTTSYAFVKWQHSMKINRQVGNSCLRQDTESGFSIIKLSSWFDKIFFRDFRPAHK